MVQVEKTVLLRHSSGWCIVYDFGFPSGNYIVMKADVGRPMQKLSMTRVAYCGSLETALNRLFQQLIIEHANMNNKYRGSLQDLRKAIDDARKDFEQLLQPRRSKG